MISRTSTIICIATQLFVVSCDRNTLSPDGEKTLPLTRSEEVFVEGNKDFASELLQMYYDKRGVAYDFVVSPISLQMFFGMLGAAASEDQAQGINRMLGYDGSSSADINNFCQKVLTHTPQLDPKVTVGVANQWWLNEDSGFNLYDPFAQLLKDYYQVDPATKHFNHDPMSSIVHDWIFEHTRGMIDLQYPAPYPKQCILANATYLKAEWQEKFDKAESKAGEFRTEDGSSVQVVYMDKTLNDAEGYSDQELDALFLPLGGGSFRMEFLLPKYGKKVRDVIQRLRSGDLPMTGTHQQTTVCLPTFDLACANMNLVEDVCDYFHVELSDGARNPAKYPLCGKDTEGPGMEINTISHIARIVVNEEGTEAAAVTINGRWTGIPKIRQFIADRPFVFLIREVGSGLVFFSGVYAGGSK